MNLAWFALPLTTLVVMVGLKGIEHEKNLSRIAPAKLECYTNPSGFLDQQGFRPVVFADRQRAAREGKELRLEPALLCVERDSLNTVVLQQWWYK